jgi:DNA-binding transcriptional ArsR family regulator
LYTQGTHEQLSELFRVLADPQRIAILMMVHERELPAGEIAKHFHTTRQAISQHLRQMTDAGLLDLRREGTKRIYRVRAEGLGKLRSFLERFWDDRLSALKSSIERDKGVRRGRR